MSKYQLLRTLGKGGFGEVHEARHLDSGRLIAIKILAPGPGFTPQSAKSYWEKSGAYRGEGIILPQLDHKHIVNCFRTAGWTTRQPKILMDLMEGSLDDLLSSSNTPCLTLANDVLHQMLRALDYLSERGFVHRDVKPENIFYTTLPTASSTATSVFAPAHPRCPQRRQQQTPQPPPPPPPPPPAQYHFRLGDFGLCDSEDNITSPTTVRGTRLFLAPELLAPVSSPKRAPQSHKSDVWALYVTMLLVLDVHGMRESGELLGLAAAVGGAAFELASLLGSAGAGEPRARVMREMARLEPEWRANAWEVLEAVFGEKGYGA